MIIKIIMAQAGQGKTCELLGEVRMDTQIFTNEHSVPYLAERMHSLGIDIPEDLVATTRKWNGCIDDIEKNVKIILFDYDIENSKFYYEMLYTLNDMGIDKVVYTKQLSGNHYLPNHINRKR